MNIGTKGVKLCRGANLLRRRILEPRNKTGPKCLCMVLSQEGSNTFVTSAIISRSISKRIASLGGIRCSSTTAKTHVTSGGLADQALQSKIQKETKDSDKEVELNFGVDPENQKKNSENQKRAIKFTFIAFGGILGGLAVYIFFTYGAPLYDRHGNPIPDEFSDLPFVQQYTKRSLSEIKNYMTFIANPSRENLLPDPWKPPYRQPKYTLLLELTDVLVHPEWTYKTGWRFKKRPGIDHFLSQLSGYYFELCIFTSEQGFTAFPIIDVLDKENLILYRLFRDSTKYENGVHVKPLNKLNRDLSKVIMVDCNERAISAHRSNAIVLPRWKGNDDDRTLYDLASLLQTLAASDVDDVRAVLEYYSKFDDPIEEFRSKQRQILEQEQSSKPPALPDPLSPSTTGNWLMSMLKQK